jgi:hypothetical protein
LNVRFLLGGHQKVVVVRQQHIYCALVKTVTWEVQVRLKALLSQLELQMRDQTALLDVVMGQVGQRPVGHDVFNQFTSAWKAGLWRMGVELENSTLAIVVLDVNISYVVKVVAHYKSESDPSIFFLSIHSKEYHEEN